MQIPNKNYLIGGLCCLLLAGSILAYKQKPIFGGLVNPFSFTTQSVDDGKEGEERPEYGYCGDAIIQAGESCDDGNTISGDGCSTACVLETCGDGLPGPGEQCDDGNFINTDSCTNVCLNPVCGDSYVQAGEQCDDGNTSNNDSCDNWCEFPGTTTPTTTTPGTTTTPTTTTTTAPTINGVCGSAAKTYAATDTSYGSNSFCANGTVTPTPLFPLIGGSVSRTCKGSNGGINVMCTAIRLGNVIPSSGAVCGNGIVEGNEQCDETTNAFCPVNVCSSRCKFLGSCSGVCGSHNKKYFDYETNPPANIATGRCSQGVFSGLSYSNITHQWTRTCLNYGLPATTANCVAYDITGGNITGGNTTPTTTPITTTPTSELTKYICNGNGKLEKHQNQPGYPTDGQCNTNMQARQTCASLDKNLAGTQCISIEKDPCIWEKLITPIVYPYPDDNVVGVVHSITSLGNNTVSINLKNDGYYGFQCPHDYLGFGLVYHGEDGFINGKGYYRVSDDIRYIDGHWIFTVGGDIAEPIDFNRLPEPGKFGIGMSMGYENDTVYTTNLFCAYENGIMCKYTLPEPQLRHCGDGKLQNGEECDDGNEIDTDSCGNDCKKN